MDAKTVHEPEWHTTNHGRTIYGTADDLARENAKESQVKARLESAPSFGALLKAYDRFRRDLNKYDYKPDVIRRKPWDLLTAYAGVMNAKSARAVTLRKLSQAVTIETGLPRHELGRFRGSDGINWDAVTP